MRVLLLPEGYNFSQRMYKISLFIKMILQKEFYFTNLILTEIYRILTKTKFIFLSNNSSHNANNKQTDTRESMEIF